MKTLKMQDFKCLRYKPSQNVFPQQHFSIYFMLTRLLFTACTSALAAVTMLTNQIETKSLAVSCLKSIISHPLTPFHQHFTHRGNFVVSWPESGHVGSDLKCETSVTRLLRRALRKILLSAIEFWKK